MAESTISDEEYRALAAFRAELRRFLRFSEDAARAAGMSPQQHQLLLAIRGHPSDGPPTVGDLAAALQVKPHSMVGLINRTAQAGYLRREPSPTDQRVVHVMLTDAGNEVLRSLTDVHRGEHVRLDRVLRRLLAQRSASEPAGDGDTAASEPLLP
ncbi:MAG: MarR family transcriptional regulator [Thermomicrobiales bacterium]